MLRGWPRRWSSTAANLLDAMTPTNSLNAAWSQLDTVGRQLLSLPPSVRAGQASGARLFATSGENTLGNPPSAICNSAASTTIKSSPPRGNPAVLPLGPLLKASLACWIRRMAQSNSDRRSVLRRASSARGSRDWLSGYVQIARSEPGSGGQRALASLGASCLWLARAWDKVST